MYPSELNILTPFHLAQIQWLKENYAEYEFILFIGRAVPLETEVEDGTSFSEPEEGSNLENGPHNSYPIIGLQRLDEGENTWSRIIFFKGSQHVIKQEDCNDLSRVLSPKCWGNHQVTWYKCIIFSRLELEEEIEPIDPELQDLLNLWKLQASQKIPSVFN